MFWFKYFPFVNCSLCVQKKLLLITSVIHWFCFGYFWTFDKSNAKYLYISSVTSFSMYCIGPSLMLVRPIFGEDNLNHLNFNILTWLRWCPTGFSFGKLECFIKLIYLILRNKNKGASKCRANLVKLLNVSWMFGVIYSFLAGISHIFYLRVLHGMLLLTNLMSDIIEM